MIILQNGQNFESIKKNRNDSICRSLSIHRRRKRARKTSHAQLFDNLISVCVQLKQHRVNHFEGLLDIVEYVGGFFRWICDYKGTWTSNIFIYISS